MVTAKGQVSELFSYQPVSSEGPLDFKCSLHKEVLDLCVLDVTLDVEMQNSILQLLHFK